MKTITCLSILLIGLVLSLGVVCASENLNETSLMGVDETPIDDLSSFTQNENVPLEEQGEEILSADEGSFSELQDLIDRSSAGSTINLTKDYSYKNQDLNNLKISKDLTINGNNHTIDANDLARIFFIKNSNVIINNITFKNAKTFLISDNADYSGSVINSYLSNIEINNCNFYNNTASDGGNDYRSNGGVIYSIDSNLEIKNSNFINNSAADDGGAIYAISNSNNNNVNIYDSSFINHETGFSRRYSGYGGAIYYSKIKSNIVSTNFSENIISKFTGYASGSGGSVYSEFSTVNVDNSKFYDSSDSHFCTVVSTLTISSSDFNNNSYYSLLDFTRYDFTTYETIYSNIIIKNSTFTDNYSPIEVYNITILDSKFDNNWKYTGPLTEHRHFHPGGVIYATYINIDNTSFNNSRAWHGGVIYGGFITVNNSNFTNNYAVEAGGAIFVRYSIEANNSNFINCTTRSQGGAIYSGGDLVADNCNFVDCSAMCGGAISTYNVLKLDSNFDNNSARLGKNIAYNNSYVDGLDSLPKNEAYQFISPIEEGPFPTLSDGYTIFFKYWEHPDYPNYHQYYPYAPEIGIWYDNYFLTTHLFFEGEKETLIDIMIEILENQKEYYLNSAYPGNAKYIQDTIDSYKFVEEKWQDLKLNKTRELLNDPNFYADYIPDNGFMKQLNETTYIFIDFELLQSEQLTLGYAKEGGGMISFWMPAYKATYMSKEEISNLTVQKISLNQTVHVGEIASFEIIVKNIGLINLTGIFVNEIIPEALAYVSHSNDDVWIKTGNVFNYLKSLGVNESVRFTINFNTTKVGNITNVVIAGSNETGNKTSNNTTEVVNKTETPENVTEIPKNVTDTPEDEPVFDDYAKGPGDHLTLDEESPQQKSVAAKVEKNATGNPIFLILLVFLMGITTLRRRD